MFRATKSEKGSIIYDENIYDENIYDENADHNAEDNHKNVFKFWVNSDY